MLSYSIKPVIKIVAQQNCLQRAAEGEIAAVDSCVNGLMRASENVKMIQFITKTQVENDEKCTRKKAWHMVVCVRRMSN